jgi:hypothetical protein
VKIWALVQDGEPIDIDEQSVLVGFVALVSRLKELDLERLLVWSSGYKAVHPVESKDVDLFSQH